ncbi:hypothetical protein CSAL01_04423 [Colletotrichum salicis]|uniref:Uncharacterized protein n=1 Tax=Colletotrichum salicis TaxID=1209931 RepID=A0A135SDU6_9PEZI|nr:hypothetical protein CSAL01_04423 [Colletotrichum salicis]
MGRGPASTYRPLVPRDHPDVLDALWAAWHASWDIGRDDAGFLEAALDPQRIDESARHLGSLHALVLDHCDSTLFCAGSDNSSVYLTAGRRLATLRRGLGRKGMMFRHRWETGLECFTTHSCKRITEHPSKLKDTQLAETGMVIYVMTFERVTATLGEPLVLGKRPMSQ